MRATAAISVWVVRVAGIVQLVLGALFWTGHAYRFVPLHIISGVSIVLTLWTVAVMAVVVRTHRGLALFGLLWGVALPVFGMLQAGMVVGSMHWVIRVIHLVMGLIAMGVAGTLGQAILALPRHGSEPARQRQAVTS